jgi:hypothetical protein
LTAEIAAAIAAGAGRELGSGYQASVHLYRTSAGNVVVKQPHRGGPLGALWRSLLRGTRFDGCTASPAFLARSASSATVGSQRVAGPSLREQRRGSSTATFFACWPRRGGARPASRMAT